MQETYSVPGSSQASMSKIQGLFKDFSRLSYSFQEYRILLFIVGNLTS